MKITKPLPLAFAAFTILLSALQTAKADELTSLKSKDVVYCHSYLAFMSLVLDEITGEEYNYYTAPAVMSALAKSTGIGSDEATSQFETGKFTMTLCLFGDHSPDWCHALAQRCRQVIADHTKATQR